MKMLVKIKRPGRLPHPGHSPLAAAPSQVTASAVEILRAWSRLPATTCQKPRQETGASTTAAPATDRHTSTLGIPTAGVGYIKKKHILEILQTLASDYSILFYFVGDEERASSFDAGFPASAPNTGTIDGGFGTIGRLTVEQDDMVTKLMSRTGIKNVDHAREFLQRNGWQLEINVNAYHSMGRYSTGDSRHLPLSMKYCRNTTDV